MNRLGKLATKQRPIGTGSNMLYDTSGRTPVSSASAGAANWVLPSADVDMFFSAGQYFGRDPSQLTFTRATTAIGTFSDGHMILYGSGVPVITDMGLQLWQAATNFILQSQFAASWTATRSTLTANTVASPLQTTTGATLVEDATATNTHFTTQTVTKAASAILYTFSVYAKAGTRTRIMLQMDDAAGNGATGGFDLSGGQVAYAAAGLGTPFTTISSAINPLGSSGGGGGWYRCSLIATSNTATSIVGNVFLDNGSGTAAQSTSYSGDGASGLSIFGAQLEALVGPSPYVPTTTIAVVRNADVASFTMPTLGTSYSFFAQGTPLSPITSAINTTLINPFVTNDSNRVLMRRTATTGALLIVVTGGTGASLSPAGTWNFNVNGKMAVAITAGAQSGCFNGGTVVTDTAAVLPTTPTVFQIGTLASAANNFGGNVQRVGLWATTKLSNDALKSITS